MKKQGPLNDAQLTQTGSVFPLLKVTNQVMLLLHSHVGRVYSVDMSCIQKLIVHRDQNTESVHQRILV